MTAFSLSAKTLQVADELLANARLARGRVEKSDIVLGEVHDYLERANNLRKFGNVNDVFVAAAVNSWQADSKVAISVDPDMVSEIIETQAQEIPGEIFTRLPYVNPLVLFPEKLETVSSNGHRVHILGYFTYGRHDFDNANGRPDSHICNTDDSRVNRIGFLFVSYVPDTGKIDFTRVSARLTDRVSLHDAISEGVSKYSYDDSVPGVTRDGVLSWFTTLLTLGLNTSLYITTSGSDMENLPRTVVSKPPEYTPYRYARPRKMQIVKMGWRLGPHLRKLRHQYEQSKTNRGENSSGRTIAAHPVRAHFRTYWTGPKNLPQVPVVRFITPFWTGANSFSSTPNVLVRK